MSRVLVQDAIGANCESIRADDGYACVETRMRRAKSEGYRFVRSIPEKIGNDSDRQAMGQVLRLQVN